MAKGVLVMLVMCIPTQVLSALATAQLTLLADSTSAAVSTNFNCFQVWSRRQLCVLLHARFLKDQSKVDIGLWCYYSLFLDAAIPREQQLILYDGILFPLQLWYSKQHVNTAASSLVLCLYLRVQSVDHPCLGSAHNIQLLQLL